MPPPHRPLPSHPRALAALSGTVLLLAAAAAPAQIVSEPNLKRGASAVVVQPIQVSTSVVPSWPDPPPPAGSPHKSFPAGPAGSSSGPTVRDPSGGTLLAGPVVPAVPVIGASWPGIGPNDGGLRPDPTLAVGASHVVVAVNDDLGVFTKAGVLLAQLDFNVWLGSDDKFFDPKCAFDFPAQRFLCVVLRKRETATEKKSWWTLLASDDGDPTGLWHLYDFDATVDGKTPNGLWADYPYLGFDQFAIYLTANMVTWNPQAIQYAKIRILDKGKIYNGLGSAWWDFWDLQSGAPSCGVVQDWSLAPAQVMDTSSPAGYVLNAEACGGNTLTLRRITQPLNWVAGPTLTTELIPVNAYTLPPQVQQPKVGGVAMPFQQMPNYLTDKAILRGGHLYSCHNAGFQWSGDPGPRSVLRLYDLLPIGLPTTVARQSQFGLPGYDYYLPSNAPTSTQDMVIGFARSSDVNNEFPSLRYTVWPSGGALIGSKSVKKGTGTYTKNSWGDYFSVQPDPSDPDYLWFFGEYALAGSSWNNWVAEIQVP